MNRHDNAARSGNASPLHWPPERLHNVRPLFSAALGIIVLQAIIVSSLILLPGPASAGQQSQSAMGKASWYGTTAHGKITANGEVYNRYALTAAHKKLPFGHVVRVRNLRNKRSVLVRINDRGPYIDGRVLDVSFRAAQILAMTGSGVAPVRFEIVSDRQGLPLTKGNAYYIHMAGEDSLIRALSLTVTKRIEKDLPIVTVVHLGTDTPFYSICLGPFETFTEAQSIFLEAEGNVLDKNTSRRPIGEMENGHEQQLGIIEAPRFFALPYLIFLYDNGAADGRSTRSLFTACVRELYSMPTDMLYEVLQAFGLKTSLVALSLAKSSFPILCENFCTKSLRKSNLSG